MKRTVILSIFIFLLIIPLNACAPHTLPAESAPLPSKTIERNQTLTVFAAASLTESFSELGEVFEAQNPTVKVSFNFAGSQQLAQQLGHGANADVFASANNKYMDNAVETKLVTQTDVKVFAHNRLVVIFPKDNPANLNILKDLAKPGLKLDLADASVPVGQYSLNFLDKASNDPVFGVSFKDDVLKNVVSYEENVKSVLTKVALGEVDAGIVYVTDITPEAAKLVGVIEIPDALNTIATYPIAALIGSKNRDLANAFIQLVLSPEGKAVLEQYGFIPASK